MNRKIAFRAWDVENNKMIQSYAHVSKYGQFYTAWTSTDSEREYIPMQYTGLKDKNGKKIFEGDVVECVFATGKEFCKVIEEKGCFWVSQKGMKYLQTEAHDNLYWHNSECEIIGNIYENPELLDNN